MSPLLRYDHYKVLGIARDASVAQIKRAFRERVKHCHPDRNHSANAAPQFHMVHEAYRVLMDPELRKNYDERLRHYRESKPEEAAKEPRNTSRFARRPERPIRGMDRFVFRGLHLTGLLFGSALIAGVLIGMTFFAWPAYMLVLCIPGMAVLPDSIAGLRH